MSEGRVLFLRTEPMAAEMSFFPVFLGELGYETVLQDKAPVSLSESDGRYPDLVICLGKGNRGDWFWPLLAGICNIPVLYVYSGPNENLPTHVCGLEMPVTMETFSNRVSELLPERREHFRV